MAQVDRFLPTTVTTPEPGKTYCSMSLILLHPLTRGTVHIVSKDPKQPPVIDPRWLENDIDADLIAEGIAMARKMIATDPLRGFIAKEIAPGPEVQGEGVKDFVRATVGSTFHPLGTAAMLPEDDNGVVGPDLKVYGTENLRIVSQTSYFVDSRFLLIIPQVDASILPIQMSSHIQTTVYALAEKVCQSLVLSVAYVKLMVRNTVGRRYHQEVHCLKQGGIERSSSMQRHMNHLSVCITSPLVDRLPLFRV